MRIMLINQYAGSPSLGMEFRPHSMARAWRNLGHHVLIVTGSYSHLRNAQPLRGIREVDGINYLTVGTPTYHNNGAGRLANIAWFRSRLFSRASELATWQPDVVIASSTHPMDVRPAAKIAKRAGAKFVFEVHDLWPLTPMLAAGVSARHPVIRWMQREEDFGYSVADLVVSLLPGTEE